MAVVHGFAALAILLALGGLTWRFARRPGVAKAAALAACIAFLPVATVAETATRMVVDMHQGSGTYDLAMSDGRKDRPRENRWFMGTVSAISRASLLDAMAYAPLEATLGDVSTVVVDHAWDRVSTIRSIASTVFDVAAVIVGALLFGWTTSRFLAQRRRLAGQGAIELVASLGPSQPVHTKSAGG